MSVSLAQKLLKCNRLSSILSINHGFFGREGGVSEGIYGSLNVGLGSDDNPQHIAENRQRVAVAIGGNGAKLNTLYQVHSPNVVVVDELLSVGIDAPKADAMVTNKQGLILGVLTADCAPVLFCDPVAGVIGAAHAGWTGAIANVIENTVAQMAMLGAKRENIIATIGPCIGQSSYEVGVEFFERFIADNPDNSSFFVDGVGGKYHFNLSAYVADKLRRSAVQNINVLHNDTCADEKSFFSNRRRNLRNEPDYGRQVSAIMLV